MPCSRCEAQSQSEHPNPGIVANDEVLIRHVFLPEQVEADGSLKPTAISKDDFKRIDGEQSPTRGYSCSRLTYVDMPTFEALGREMVGRNADRTGSRIFACETSQVRAILHDGDRCVCVVDRGLPSDPSHAELWGARAYPKGTLKFIRERIASLMKPLAA